jgi:UDP-N-acetylmuramoyl-L-alanyl-D-glutamate--2,6-diaminopimelate ligase
MIRNLKNFGHLLQAVFANLIYRFPSRNLTVIGVTGTDGKTTTVHLIYHILSKAGIKADLISTISAPGLHTTTPDSMMLQKMLRKMVNQGIKYVVLESSSHGLDQHRLWGVKYRVGVVTNITHDHLDYHKTIDRYRAAKAKMFRGVKTAILNRDDKSYESLEARIKKPCLPAGRQELKIITYGIENPADFTPESLPGVYNQYNCLAAIAAAKSLGIPDEKIRRGVAGFGGVIGRMEGIKEGQNFRVIIDFAKTPSGLESALKTLKSQLPSSGRLIAVFGSAGLRDVAKRAMMGEVGAKLADISILTAEDPRTEDVNKIIEQMAQGCVKAGGVEKKSFFRISDRRKAIRFAVTLAQEGDIVVLCGKGHERSMCYGKKEFPWNEQAEARRALIKLKKHA